MMGFQANGDLVIMSCILLLRESTDLVSSQPHLVLWLYNLIAHPLKCRTCMDIIKYVDHAGEPGRRSVRPNYII